MRKTGAIKFVEYVNRNIGKSLTTGTISKKTEVHMRRVQSFCKAVRGTKKVSAVFGRSIIYTFRKPITVADIR